MNKIITTQSTSTENLLTTLLAQQSRVSLPAIAAVSTGLTTKERYESVEELQNSLNFKYHSLSSQVVYMRLARNPHLIAQVFASALHP